MGPGTGGFAAPTAAGDVFSYLADGLAPAWWDLHVKYTANPEVPVELAARVHVT